MRNHLHKCPSSAAQDLRAARWAALRFRAAATCRAAQPRCTHKSGYNFGLQTPPSNRSPFQAHFPYNQHHKSSGNKQICMFGIRSSSADWHPRAVGQAMPWVPTAPWLHFLYGKLGKGLTGTKINSIHRADVSAISANPTGWPGKSICGVEAPMTKSSC